MIELPTESEPVRVVCGDALEVLRELPDGCMDAVVTDPPFSNRTHRDHDASARGHKGEGNDGAARKALGYEAWTQGHVEAFVPELCRVASGWVVVMNDHTNAPHICRTLEGCGRYVFAPLPFYAPGSRCRLSGDGPSSWTDWIIVARTTKQLRWGTLPGGYLAEGSRWREKEHMGGKPLALMEALIRDYSREGDLILDPFAGSGTTGIAAIHEGRRAILVEKDPRYCDIIRRRVAEALAEGPGSLFSSRAETPSLFTEESA